MNICIYCGASLGKQPEYRQNASLLGHILANRKHTLIYGGADTGLMGEAADAALKAGGEVIGVIPSFLVDLEVAHRKLTKLHIVQNLHERKSLMADLAQGFIALPGGFGTFEELFETLTWSQLGLHQKPILLLNTRGYYDGLLSFLDQATTQGFVRTEHRALVLEASTPEVALDIIENFVPPPKVAKDSLWRGDKR